MSNMMIYATTDKVGGNIENVWGYKMRVRTIDSSDKELAETLQAEGWMPKADDVIEQIETEKLEAENEVMRKVLVSDKPADVVKGRVKELEEQLSTALTEIAGFEQERAESDKVIDEKIARIAELEPELAGVLTDNAKLESELKQVQAKLAIYEESKDANGDGVVSYDEMEVKELHALLDQRGVKYVSRDTLKDLIKKAKDSE